MFPDNRTDKVQAFQEPLETHGFCILLTYKARVSPSPLMTQYLLLFHLTHLWVYVFLNNLLDIWAQTIWSGHVTQTNINVRKMEVK